MEFTLINWLESCQKIISVDSQNLLLRDTPNNLQKVIFFDVIQFLSLCLWNSMALLKRLFLLFHKLFSWNYSIKTKTHKNYVFYRRNSSIKVFKVWYVDWKQLPNLIFMYETKFDEMKKNNNCIVFRWTQICKIFYNFCWTLCNFNNLIFFVDI